MHTDRPISIPLLVAALAVGASIIGVRVFIGRPPQNRLAPQANSGRSNQPDFFTTQTHQRSQGPGGRR
jgi:hypothetical protein